MTDALLPSGWLPHELERAERCPACASRRSEPAHSDLRDNMEGVPGEWTMRRCLDCRSLYLDVRPTVDAIGKAYQSYHTHADGRADAVADNGSTLLWRWSNGYMNARFGAGRSPASNMGSWVMPLLVPLRQQLDYFYRHLPSHAGRLLDVGCGNGVFLQRAAQAGWDVKGIEPDARAVDAARRTGLDVIEGTLDSVGDLGMFDVITASHVIEHVHDPSAFLRQIFERLRPGGRVWLATPNVDSLGHRRFAGAWRGLEPPRHITVLSLPALSGLLADAGFDQITAHRRGRGSRYILQVSAETARRHGMSITPLPHQLVDVLATFSPSMAEECVVSAVKGAS